MNRGRDLCTWYRRGPLRLAKELKPSSTVAEWTKIASLLENSTGIGYSDLIVRIAEAELQRGQSVDVFEAYPAIS